MPSFGEEKAGQAALSAVSTHSTNFLTSPSFSPVPSPLYPAPTLLQLHQPYSAPSLIIADSSPASSPHPLPPKSQACEVSNNERKGVKSPLFPTQAPSALAEKLKSQPPNWKKTGLAHTQNGWCSWRAHCRRAPREEPRIQR